MSDPVLWHDPESDAYTVRSKGVVEEVGPVTVEFIKELLDSNASLRESMGYLMLRLIMAEGGTHDA
jgi:hypothetical protein